MVDCCYCGASVPQFGPSVFRLVIDEPSGPKVAMTWCRDCADMDAEHIALAHALGLPDGRETGDAIAAAYLALQQRIAAQRGCQGLRRAIDVRRDVEGVKTFRGEGLAWGRLSWR